VEGGIRVPCVARLPGVIPAGGETKQVAITMDWTATMAAMAGASVPKDKPFDGIDLLPILSGKSPQAQRTLFWRRVEPRDPRIHVAVRDGNWKYILQKENGVEFLFDLDNDIRERNNLAAENAERCAQLKAKIVEWEKQMKPAN
jgi:arylsulfatase A